MKTFKATITNLSSIVLALIFVAGCATVTDTNMDLTEADEPAVITTTVDNGNDWFNRAGDGLDPIIDGPDD